MQGLDGARARSSPLAPTKPAVGRVFQSPVHPADHITHKHSQAGIGDRALAPHENPAALIMTLSQARVLLEYLRLTHRRYKIMTAVIGEHVAAVGRARLTGPNVLPRAAKLQRRFQWFAAMRFEDALWYLEEGLNEAVRAAAGWTFRDEAEVATWRVPLRLSYPGAPPAEAKGLDETERDAREQDEMYLYALRLPQPRTRELLRKGPFGFDLYGGNDEPQLVRD